jgi:predicted helicase
MSNDQSMFDSLPIELQETLDKWSYITVNELKLSLAENKVHLGNLYRSFTRQISYGADGMPTKVSIGFLFHGRFVDMGVSKGIKLENIKGNAEIWRNKSREQRKGQNHRRPKKWYSPTMYREYQRAAEILAGKYGIEIPARFENIFTERIELN